MKTNVDPARVRQALTTLFEALDPDHLYTVNGVEPRDHVPGDYGLRLDIAFSIGDEQFVTVLRLDEAKVVGS